MSLKIIKAGILDSLQDPGRYGYQHLGINPGGAMDKFAAALVNILVGNDVNEAVIEMHFPASTFLFEEEAMIAIGGGDFSATVNGEEVSLWHPIIISRNSILQFQKWKQGARCYLSVREKMDIPKWLNSYSTNIKAGCGGYFGRALQKDDVIQFSEENNYRDFLQSKNHISFPWSADVNWSPAIDKIAVTAGNEWDWLSRESQHDLLLQQFSISSSADRMGYRLNGKLISKHTDELVSSSVSFGTVQLLPNGGLIILMADHQTTGGYPRVAHVITAHLPALAQMRAGEKINFRITDQNEAEKLLVQQQEYLLQLEKACKFRLQEFLNEQNRH
jgi:antagonist of KipI